MTLFEQVVRLLASLNETELGRLRSILIQPGYHRRPAAGAKVGTNVVQGK